MTEQDLIQSHWRQQESLHVNGITLRSGRVVLLSTSKVQLGADMACVVTPLADTTVESVLKYNQEAWVTITTTETCNVDESGRLLAGEGAMGNEGFVALECGGDLEWILFCTGSNPFADLALLDGVAVVVDGYGGTWRIPLAEPESFHIERS